MAKRQKKEERLKRIIVTPAGRRRYLKILMNNLDKEIKHFDEWHLWMNTTDKEDLKYIRKIARENDWIKAIKCPVDVYKTLTISKFFPVDAVDPDAVYLRLDDDICWIALGAVDKMFTFRIDNPEYMLVFGNIVNNAVCGHLHQRFGVNGYEHGKNGYACMDTVGWYKPEYAEMVHNNFLDRMKNLGLGQYIFPRWELWDYERFSINVMSWLGKDFAKFGGKVDQDEEPWLTHTLTKDNERIACINGEALFVHFAFYTQREFLEKNTDLLKEYYDASLCRSI